MRAKRRYIVLPLPQLCARRAAQQILLGYTLHNLTKVESPESGSADYATLMQRVNGKAMPMRRQSTLLVGNGQPWDICFRERLVMCNWIWITIRIIDCKAICVGWRLMQQNATDMWGSHRGP